MKKILFVLALATMAITGCKNEAKKDDKKTETVAENIKETSFKISGMTCETGCAKTIASKLSKKEGIIDAKVIFSDSIAKVKYDASKIDQAKIKTFVEGIADGKTYKTCTIKKECSKAKKQCDTTKTASCDKTKKENNKSDCQKECCAKKG